MDNLTRGAGMSKQFIWGRDCMTVRLTRGRVCMTVRFTLGRACMTFRFTWGRACITVRFTWGRAYIPEVGFPEGGPAWLLGLPKKSLHTWTSFNRGRACMTFRFTWGRACMTVSRSALIPLAIFNNLRTLKIKVKNNIQDNWGVNIEFYMNVWSWRSLFTTVKWITVSIFLYSLK